MDIVKKIIITFTVNISITMDIVISDIRIFQLLIDLNT
jgi:hypothetical protein